SSSRRSWSASAARSASCSSRCTCPSSASPARSRLIRSSMGRVAIGAGAVSGDVRNEARPMPLAGDVPDDSLHGRLAWITGLRLVFLTLLLAATVTLYWQGELDPYPFSTRVVLVTIGAGFAMAGI